MLQVSPARWEKSEHPVPFIRGRSSTWLEHRPVKPEVAGSSPVGPAQLLL